MFKLYLPNMQEIKTNLKISSFCVNVLSILIPDLIGSDPINTQTGPNMIAMSGFTYQPQQ